MSAPHIFKLKYCDENSGWSDKRNGASMSFSAKTLMAMNADLSGMELADVDRLIEYIANNTIAIITAQNISSAQLSRFRSNTLIRKSYGMLETGRAEQQQHDAGLVILVRVGLPADIEAIKMEAKSTRALNILLRVLGVTLAVSVLLVDPSAGQPRRLSALNAVIKSLPQADAVFLVGSLPDNWAQSEEFMHEMQSARINGGFSDPAEEGMERGTYTNATFHAWFKSVKLAAAPTLVECAGRGQEYRHVAITIAARTSLATTIAIPMPRSATTGTSAKSPSASPSAANPILTDPAVLSVEAAKAGGGGSASQSASAELLMRIGRQGQQATPQSPQQPAKWDASHCFLLKGNDTKLNNWEKQLDLSKLFKTTATAVSELNTRFSFWPADYCVVHNTVLCSVAINNNERPTFRRYLRDNSNNTALHSQLTAALTRYASSRQEKSAWGKPGDGDEVSLLFQRQKKEDGGQQRKEWSDANCTIVYQITPREMKFNVSHYVGMEKGNLATVIQMLNRDKLLSKENALAAYPYDYALLYSMELQAYWLLAASHVPCDIVACRMMAQ